MKKRNSKQSRLQEKRVARISTVFTAPLLGQVIRELKPKDRVFSESVCTKWNLVSRAHGWLNYLLIARNQWSDEWKDTNLPPGHQIAELLEIVERELKCLLCRCASTVRVIDLSGIEAYGLDGRVCELLTGGMKMLVVLNLNGVPLNCQQLIMIGDYLPGLRELSMGACLPQESEVESALAYTLSSCRRLVSLKLNDNPTLTGNPSFSNLPATCCWLELYQCHSLHPSVVDSLIACSGNLRILSLWSATVGAYDNFNFKRLFATAVNLRNLYLMVYDGEQVEDAWKRFEGIGALKQLRDLSLHCNETAVTSEVINEIVEGCRELESVSMGHISSLFIYRLAELPQLVYLQVSHHPSINDEALAKLAAGPARLRELNISDCKNVTDKSVIYLLEGFGGQLHELDVSYCPLITQATVAKLEALYNEPPKWDNKDGPVFILKAVGRDLGFTSKEFGMSHVN